MRSRSVHGAGMREDLIVVGLDAAFTVRSWTVLRPGRALRVAGAVWVLELPTDCCPPVVGDRLVVRGASCQATST